MPPSLSLKAVATEDLFTGSLALTPIIRRPFSSSPFFARALSAWYLFCQTQTQVSRFPHSIPNDAMILRKSCREAHCVLDVRPIHTILPPADEVNNVSTSGELLHDKSLRRRWKAKHGDPSATWFLQSNHKPPCQPLFCPQIILPSPCSRDAFCVSLHLPGSFASGDGCSLRHLHVHQQPTSLHQSPQLSMYR